MKVAAEQKVRKQPRATLCSVSALLLLPSRRCGWHGRGAVTAGRGRRHRAAFSLSDTSSHRTQCLPVQQHWEETGALGRFWFLSSFLGGTDPAPGLPNQSRQSSKQALNHLDTAGISLPGDWAQFHLSPRTGGGQLEQIQDSKHPFFSPRYPIPPALGSLGSPAPQCYMTWVQSLLGASSCLTLVQV